MYSPTFIHFFFFIMPVELNFTIFSCASFKRLVLDLSSILICGIKRDRIIEVSFTEANPQLKTHKACRILKL